MKNILLVLSLSVLTLSFVVVKNNQNSEGFTYKKLKLVDTYDTVNVRIEKPSNLIFSITLKNSDNLKIEEEWDYNSNGTNYTVSKYFTHNNVKYLEEWHYKKGCLVKIAYLIESSIQNTKETSYQWMENQNIKNCGN
jgi:hypothetical protein